jgi:hypothetical protein
MITISTESVWDNEYVCIIIFTIFPCVVVGDKNVADSEYLRSHYGKKTEHWLDNISHILIYSFNLNRHCNWQRAVGMLKHTLLQVPYDTDLMICILIYSTYVLYYIVDFLLITGNQEKKSMQKTNLSEIRKTGNIKVMFVHLRLQYIYITLE